MELTRRDAILALAGGGVAVGAKSIVEGPTGGREAGADGQLSAPTLDTLVATAEVLYPDQVDPSREFVEAYATRRFGDQLVDLEAAIDSLHDTARQETGRRFETLSPGKRGAVLRAVGADRAYPDPEGTTPQQLRYYLVNGLLFALYSTPKGAGLVGSANPEGYPGGQEEYQRRPER